MKTAAGEFIAGFGEEQFNRLDTSREPALLRAKREEAFGVYGSMPSPTNRTEEWRRTDPALFSFGRLAPLPPLAQGNGAGESAWDSHFDMVISIGDDGYSVQDRTGLGAGRQVRIGSLAETAAAEPELIREFLQTRALPPSTDKFAALNQAFWNVGFCLRVADGVRVEKGILLRYDIRKKSGTLLPRLLVVTGARSEVTIAEHFTSPDDLDLLCVITKELYVGEGSRLCLVSLQEWGLRTALVDNDRAHVARDGVIDWFTFNFGTKVSKMKFGSDVAGPGSKAELDGIYFATGDQHMDQKTLQIHSSPHTYSRLLYKGAVKDRGHSVYQGIIQARPGAIDVDAYQTNNNLVLNDGAKADTIPGLLIDADDLKCSHGATIGNLDEAQLFYLRSRGLSNHEARKIIIMGYFEEIADRIPYGFMKTWIHDRIEEKLGRIG